MQSEVFGARLAAKYLDKELAGRIQQIQLLGRGMRGCEHDRLWSQLESEIHLHRHKTVIKACRGRDWVRDAPNCSLSTNALSSTNRGTVSRKRLVRLTKSLSEGLGLSITGGKEHGVPILISEIHAGQPAERCGQLHVGDAIVSVNGVELGPAKHEEAVAVLSAEMCGNTELLLEVVYVNPDIDSDDEGKVEVETEEGVR